MHKTLLITSRRSYCFLSQLNSFITDIKIVLAIDFREYLNNKNIIKGDFDSVLIDNEVTPNEAVIEDIVSKCIDENLQIYIYKPINLNDNWISKTISLTNENNVSEADENTFSLPVIYIMGEAPMAEILSSHIVLSSCLNDNALKVANFSNIQFSEKIGFNTYKQLISNFFENNILYYNYKKTSFFDQKDLLILSDGCYSWNFQSQSNMIPMNDICKNIIPYDYVLFYIPLDEYTQIELTRLKEKVQILTGCDKVDFCISHYFKDVLSGKDEQYMCATDTDYINIKNSCSSSTDYFLYDGSSKSDLLLYVSRITSV